MGRRPAIAVHLALSLVGAVLYIVFVIPRWWVLLGDFPTTLSTAGRIAAGFPIGLAAIPVALYLKESLTADPRKPEISLRLRAWSAVLHVVAGALIVLTAVAEIWLPLQSAGRWLFAVYGAAGAIAILGALAFSLSLIAEQPPRPPKAPKPAKPGKQKKPRGKRKRAEDAASAAAETSEVETAATDVVSETETEPDSDASTANADVSEPPAGEPTVTGGLRNKRPTGKSRNPLRR